MPDISTVDSWDAFVRNAEALTTFDDVPPYKYDFIFRGQCDEEYGLGPSLTRLAVRDGLTQLQALEVETAILREFQRSAPIHLPASHLPPTDQLDPWWIIMQHYGAPTRTLDWTRSPYVALYFAVEQAHEKNGAIWAVHPSAVNYYVQKLLNEPRIPANVIERNAYLTSPTPKDALYFVVPNLPTERMVAQQTVVTMSPNVVVGHDAIFETAMTQVKSLRRESVFKKFIIPKDLKSTLLLHLRRMNISAPALFPGIDGLGRGTAELARLSVAFYSKSTKPLSTGDSASLPTS